MSQIIKASENKIMPWKNGFGSTAEIAIFPADSSVADNNFDYRISSAKVSAPGPFSRFVGYDRILCVIEGPAVRINGERHEAFAPFKFPGEEEVYAALYGTPVLDIGIIFRRHQFNGNIVVVTVDGTSAGTQLNLSAGIHFILCAEGSCEINGELLNKGDTFKTDIAEKILIKSTAPVKCVHVSVNKIS